MYPASLQKLIDLFIKLPGIGPRQASRFVFALVKDPVLLKELAVSLDLAHQKIEFCSQCFRTVEQSDQGILFCAFCRDERRDAALIAVVEKESDLQAVEKSAYRGVYHVLGGTLSTLDADSPKRLHLRALYERVKMLLEKNQGQGEVILATNPTTEGDFTALYIERILAPLKDAHQGFIISRLGRGLSLGSELEHVDEVTIKNALINRK